MCEKQAKKEAKASITAICLSDKKHIPKKPVNSADLNKDWGIVGDCHAGPGYRQVSLLFFDSIEKIKSRKVQISHGDFGENLVISGITISECSPGQLIRIGENVIFEITIIGKECHSPCRIYKAVGFCIMPEEGVFCKVVTGGKISLNDKVEFA